MLAAGLITAIGGIVVVLLTTLAQWWGPKAERELMEKDLAILAAMEKNSPEWKHLRIVIQDRAKSWRLSRTEAVRLDRSGNVALIGGLLLLVLSSVVSGEPWAAAGREAVRIGLMFLGALFCAIGVSRFVKAASLTKAEQKKLDGGEGSA